ncbi:MAG TPA: SRPBCC domain-containing protein [Terriglobales bacterium]|jgi:uncharacterized protein YndB with AHSA1/START domain
MTSTSIQDDLVSETHIAAEPARVFQALVDPTQVPKWWGQEGIYRCTDFVTDLRVGGDWKSSGVGPDGGSFTVQGKYLEIDRPRLLSYTWIASWTGNVQTIVRWELAPTDKGTHVTIRHSGLAAHPELAQAYRGWPRMLGWLQVFLEKGETVQMR